MDSVTWVGMISALAAALAMSIGSLGPGLGMGRAIASALSSIAQQPDESGTISRTLFIGLAMIESVAIYCLVVALILIFANPFWGHVIGG